MLCKKFEDKIIDFISGDIDPGEKEEFMRHLKECEKCRVKFYGMKAVIEESKKIEVPVFSSEWWEKRKEEIINRGLKERVVLRRKVVIALTSFIFVFLVFSLFLKNHNNNAHMVKINKNVYYASYVSNDDLPFSEKELLKMADYMKNNEAEEILKVILK